MTVYRKTLRHRFAGLIPSFFRLPDPRSAQGRQYRMEEIMFGGLSLFLFKAGSRNQFNNHRSDGYFSAHYNQLSGMKLPHQDTVHDVLCELSHETLEQVKMDLMSDIFEQKWLRAYRLLDKYYPVAVDATGVVSFDERHCEHCLTHKSRKGKTTYFHYVLEAKLVTRDGHAFSLASEWIENPTGDYVKQDCERKAFIRLAAKLKKQYPRLPVCILADGLYPYENAFKICESNGWEFIFVLQDGSLKTVREELTLTLRREPAAMRYTVKQGWRITQEYRYQTDIDYHEKYTLNWMQCIEKKSKINQGKTQTSQPEDCRFEYVTSLQPDRNSVHIICSAGRLRWKIENEGFNTQKCGDYELEHKYSRHSYNALKNWYTLLQIAHAINQAVEKGTYVTALLKLRPKETLHNLWSKLKGYMIFCKPDANDCTAEIEYVIPPAPT